jgi:RNA polymerase sigma factor (sigma-70 family)
VRAIRLACDVQLKPAMRDDPSVVALVERAVAGDEEAWDELVERYIPLVWSICSRYRLSNHDSEDVNGTVWLLLVEHLDRLREPAALPGWLATTTQRECQRVLRQPRRTNEYAWTTLDDQSQQYPDSVQIEEEIIAAERNEALRSAFAELPPQCRRLLAMLTTDPPSSYAEISAALQIRVGSIGPQRGRCLQRMRRSKALAALIDEMTDKEAGTVGGEANA